MVGKSRGSEIVRGTPKGMLQGREGAGSAICTGLRPSLRLRPFQQTLFKSQAGLFLLIHPLSKSNTCQSHQGVTGWGVEPGRVGVATGESQSAEVHLLPWGCSQLSEVAPGKT